MDPSYLSQASIDQLLGALEKKLENVNHLANPEAITGADVDCYKTRAMAIPRRLDTLRNALQPLHKLPSELLVDIFRLSQPPLPTFPFLLSDSWHRKPAWLSITKVCGYWRYLALGTPSLWRIIAVPNMRESHEFQHWFFNKSNPMTIHLSWHNCANLFPSVVQRLETLELIISDDMEECWDILGPSIESLTTLSLRRNEFHRDLMTAPQILGGRPSNIRKLFLRDLWCWPKNNQTFQNVSHLLLSIQTLPIADLLEMMNACPSLKVLQLSQGGAWPDTPPKTPSPSFPQFNFLILEYPSPVSSAHRPTGIHSMRLSPNVQIYARGSALDIIRLADELSAEHLLIVTLLDICFVVSGSEFLLKGTSARFSLGFNDSYVNTMAEPPLFYQARYFPGTREVHFAFSSESLGKRGWLDSLELLGMAEFFSCLPDLSTVRFMTQANYVPFLDAISGFSISITEVFVKGLDPEDCEPCGISKAEWGRILSYQKAGITMIQHSQGTSSCRLVIESAGAPKYQKIWFPGFPL